jgi:hypothetical protein
LSANQENVGFAGNADYVGLPATPLATNRLKNKEKIAEDEQISLPDATISLVHPNITSMKTHL